MTKNQQYIWQVGQLCLQIGRSLSAEFGVLTVKGEISGWTQANSGHCYFNLKDSQGQLRCAMFYRAASKLNFTVKDGLQVNLLGRLGVYESRGELQMIVEQMQPLGAGDLYQQFLQLKDKLQQAGLFEEQNKKSISCYPSSIAVVTSLGAAALQDVLNTLSRRVPHIPINVFNALVQGGDAPQQLIQALQQVEEFSKTTAVDVVLLVRGGGSIEDLWAFNNEQLAQCMANYSIPIISGVGHETDFTIADFVADLRAPTPTAAAELCAISKDELLQHLANLKQKIQTAITACLDNKAQQLDRLSFRISKPTTILQQQQLLLLNIQHRLSQQLVSYWQKQHLQLQQSQQRLLLVKQTALLNQQQELSKIEGKLFALNPEAVLKRGYAIMFDQQGQAISSVIQVSPQQQLTAKLSDGEISVKVQ